MGAALSRLVPAMDPACALHTSSAPYPLPSGSDCQVLASGQAPGWVRKLNRAHPMWWDKGSSNLSAECCAGIRGRPQTPQTQEAGQASWRKERK